MPIPGLRFIIVLLFGILLHVLISISRRACKLILRTEYSNLEEAPDRLKLLSFSESVFLQKARLMYKISNNIAPEYLIELFKMRDSNNNTTSNLRSVCNRNVLIPKPNTLYFSNISSVICLDYYKECMTRKGHKNSRDVKRKMAGNFLESTDKFGKLSFSIKKIHT